MICRVPACDREVYIKKHQLCRAHYTQLIRNGFVVNKPVESRNFIEPGDLKIVEDR